MSESPFAHLDEDQQKSFLGYINRFRSYSNIALLSDILQEALTELTVFNYTLLYLYQPEQNLLTGVGPVKKSQVIRKGERFIDLELTTLSVDLTDLPEIKNIVQKKKSMELGDLETVQILQKLTQKSKKQIQSLIKMVDVRKGHVIPLTVPEGQMEKETVVGLLFVGTSKTKVERLELLKVDLLSKQVGQALHHELLQRRLRNEIRRKENSERLFETFNQASLAIQDIHDEDQIFDIITGTLKASGIGLISIEEDAKRGKLQFRHFSPPKTILSSLKKFLSVDIERFEIDTGPAKKIMALFGQKGPIYVDDLPSMIKNVLKAIGLLRHSKKIMDFMGNEKAIICHVRVPGYHRRLLIISNPDFTLDDVLAVEVFALHIKNALERLHIRRENEAKSKQIRFMHDISEALTRSLDLDKILSSLKKELHKIHDLDHISLLLMDQRLNVAIDHLIHTSGKRSRQNKRVLNLDEEAIQELARTQQLWISTTENPPTAYEGIVFKGHRFATHMVLPIQVTDNLFGSLNIGLGPGKEIGRDLLDLITSIKEPLSTAIHNANILQEETRRKDQLKIINEMSLLATKVSSVESMYKETLRIAQVKLGYKGVHVIGVDKETNQFRILHSSEPSIMEKYKDYTQPTDSGILGRSYKSKKTVLAPNVREEPDYVEFSKSIQSELAVPVIIDGDVETIINLESEEVNAFDEDDILTFETIANEISSMLKTLRIGKLEEKRVKQLALINEIGREIISQVEVEKMVEIAVSSIEEKFSFLDVTIFLLDEAKENLVLKARSRFLADELVIGLTIPVTTGIIGRVASSGRAILLNDARKDEGYKVLAEYGQRSELCSPIRTDERTIGVLNVESQMENAFDEWDLLAMESLALEIGRAIGRANVMKETERRSRLLELVNDISLRMSKELNRTKIAEVFTERFQKSRNYLDVAVFLIDKVRGLFVKHAQSGAYKGKAPVDYSQDIGEGLFGHCYQRKETVISNNVTKDQRFKSMPWLRTRSEMICPIILGQEVIGLINVESDELEAFDKWDRLAVETLSMNLAIAFHNATLFEEEQRRSDLLTMLNTISTKALQQQDLDTMFQETSETIRKKFDFYNVSIFMGAPEHRPKGLLSIRANSGGYANLAQPGTEFPDDKGLVGACYTKGATILVNDVAKDERFIAEPGSETESELCIPIKVKDRPVGVINIENDKKGSFTHWEIISLETVSDILSRAIQNMNQLNEETKHSRDISIVVEMEKGLTTMLQHDEIIKRTVEMLNNNLGYSNVEYYTIDEDNYDLVLFAIKGIYEKKFAVGYRQNMDSGVIGRAYNQKKTLLLNDTTGYTTYIEKIGKGSLSVVACPIEVGSEVVGVLSIESEEVNAFNEWDSLVINAICELLSGALDRAKKYQEEQEKDRQIRTAYELGLDVARSSSINKLFERAARSMKKMLELFDITIYTLVRERNELVIRAKKGGFRQGPKVGSKIPVSKDLIGWCISTGEDALVNDTTVDHRCVGLKGSEVKSDMVVLIRNQDEVHAIIDVRSKRFDAFTEWDLNTLKAIRVQIENVLWHMLKYDEG